METVYQAIDENGLHIPLALMRAYGLEAGAGVQLALEPDGIRIIPAALDATAIENRALRYLLRHVGDAATVAVSPLAEEAGWQAAVYAAGGAEPAGVLRYAPDGTLRPERSTSPADLRRSLRQQNYRP